MDRALQDGNVWKFSLPAEAGPAVLDLLQKTRTSVLTGLWRTGLGISYWLGLVASSYYRG
jgi:hypothetical protein